MNMRFFATALAIQVCGIVYALASDELPEASINYETPQYPIPTSARLTVDQKHQLEKFRENVKTMLTNEYERSDDYLIGWLQSKNWNIFAAKKMVKMSKVWKNYNKIEKLGQMQVEREMMERFPYTISADSDTGCPVLRLTIGDKWKISDFILSHDFPRDGVITFTKHLRQVLEILEQEQVKAYSKNKFCVAASSRMSMDGWTAATVSDMNGISAVLSIIHNYNNNYPQLLNSMVFTNVPDSFSNILEILQRSLSAHIVDILKFYRADNRPVETDSLLL